MTLTNLTFGDGKNKALLCSMKGAMEALVDQLRSPNEDLIQAAASVLRNLSWRADLASKKTLREIGTAMKLKKETTLKSILSALWNLSSHCSENKAEICAVKGALQFLVGLLTYKSAAKNIVENGGGILRNVSSQIAFREDYRQVLRQSGCLQILLHHLCSTSLTIVSNACGTLWNLSAKCEDDQNNLREMGAVSMLKNLVHSKHKMISSGSSAALRNLVSSIPSGKSVDSDKNIGLVRPSLHARKQWTLESELDPSLSVPRHFDPRHFDPRHFDPPLRPRDTSTPRQFDPTTSQPYDTSTLGHFDPDHFDPANGFFYYMDKIKAHPAFTSAAGKMFGTPSAPFSTMPVAHQNKVHQGKAHHLPMQQFSVYAETDLDSVVDQPTDFSLRYSEVSEDICSDGYQEQPINYFMRYRDNTIPIAPDIPVYQGEGHCVECKYAEAMWAIDRPDNSSNNDQLRTFCTEGAQYLSTVFDISLFRPW